MIAEYRNRRRPQVTDETQSFQRTRPAIHQIANQPQAVTHPVERTALKQGLEGGETALNIADCVGCQNISRCAVHTLQLRRILRHEFLQTHFQGNRAIGRRSLEPRIQIGLPLPIRRYLGTRNA